MFLDKELRMAIKPQRDAILDILRDNNYEGVAIGDTEITLVSKFTKDFYYEVTLETYYDGSWVITEREEESSAPFESYTDLNLHYTECTAQDVVDALVKEMSKANLSREVNIF